MRRIMEIRRARKAQQAAMARQKPLVKAVVAKGVEQFAAACVAIGISTGGPPALASLFEALEPPMPPIVVVQHMPPQFTKTLAWRLDSCSALTVEEAQDGDVLQPNHVLIAPGGKHLRLRRLGQSVQAVVFDGEAVSGHRPSVDVIMHERGRGLRQAECWESS